MAYKLTPAEAKLETQYSQPLLCEMVCSYQYLRHRITTALDLLKKHEKRVLKVHYDDPVLSLLETQDLISLLEDMDHRMSRLKRASQQ